MNKGTATEQQNKFIPFSDALDLFKPLDKNAFYYRVRKKEISTIEGKTPRDTRYSTNDIVHVREKLLQKTQKKKVHPDIAFDWLRPQDITAAMDLDYLLYSEYFIGETQLYQSWRIKNPQI